MSPTTVPIGSRAKMAGGQALAAQLAVEGVDTVFGVPGVQIYHAIDGLRTAASHIRFVTTRHEQATAYMADGYARASGRVGVCMIVPGPGMLNTLAALSTAYSCNSPVLVICGQLPRESIGRNTGALHEINDQSGVLRTVTKWSVLARTAAEIPLLVREAMVQLTTGTPKPVAIEIPPDVLAEVDDIATVPVLSMPEDRRMRPAPAAVQALADEIAASAHPVVLAGGGCRGVRAGTLLQALAERLDVPVVMTDHGLGAVPADHPLALNQLAGKAALETADLVIGVGTRFWLRVAPYGYADGARLALVNTDVEAFREPRRPDVTVTADAACLFEALLELVPERTGTAASRCASWRAETDARVASDLGPQVAWLAAIRAAMPRDAIMVGEFTQLSYAATLAFPFYTASGNITPGYQGTLGYGYATALGAAVGQPERAVVSVNGDGGFGWNLQELATAHQYGIPVAAIVVDDGAYGNVRRDQQTRFDGGVYGSELVNPDFVALAESFGVAGVRVESPEELEGELGAAIGRREPALIHVPVGPFPSPWQLLV